MSGLTMRVSYLTSLSCASFSASSRTRPAARTRPGPFRARIADLGWLSGGKPGYRSGRLHVQIKRAFAANPGRALPTGVLLAYCYPRLARYPRGHYRHVWRAASKICECLGRLPNAQGRPKTAKLRTIGFLGAGRASGYGKLADAFATRMRELGWVEGSTIAINYRWVEPRPPPARFRPRLGQQFGGDAKKAVRAGPSGGRSQG
jgi:hypothetical protein